MINKLNTHQWLSFRWDLLNYCWINSVIDTFSDNIDNYPIILISIKYNKNGKNNSLKIIWFMW